jgi:hypothetical protein
VCTLECQIAPSRENTLNYQLETGLYVASLQQCRYGRWVVVVVGLGGIPSGYAEPLSYTVHGHAKTCDSNMDSNKGVYSLY